MRRKGSVQVQVAVIRAGRDGVCSVVTAVGLYANTALMLSADKPPQAPPETRPAASPAAGDAAGLANPVPAGKRSTTQPAARAGAGAAVQTTTPPVPVPVSPPAPVPENGCAWTSPVVPLARENGLPPPPALELVRPEAATHQQQAGQGTPPDRLPPHDTTPGAPQHRSPRGLSWHWASRRYPSYSRATQRRLPPRRSRRQTTRSKRPSPPL